MEQEAATIDSNDSVIFVGEETMPLPQPIIDNNDGDDNDVEIVQCWSNENPIVIDLRNSEFESGVGVVAISVPPSNVPVPVPSTETLLKLEKNSNSKTVPIEKPDPQEPSGAVPQVMMRCPICLENMTEKQPSATACGHVFCKECIVKGLHHEPKCPVCRKKISLRQIHRIYLNPI